jgi:hypothetical protein
MTASKSLAAASAAHVNALIAEHGANIIAHNRATEAAQGDPEAIAAADAALRAATASINARR